MIRPPTTPHNPTVHAAERLKYIAPIAVFPSEKPAMTFEDGGRTMRRCFRTTGEVYNTVGMRYSAHGSAGTRCADSGLSRPSRNPTLLPDHQSLMFWVPNPVPHVASRPLAARGEDGAQAAADEVAGEEEMAPLDLEAVAGGVWRLGQFARTAPGLGREAWAEQPLGGRPLGAGGVAAGAGMALMAGAAAQKPGGGVGVLEPCASPARVGTGVCVSAGAGGSVAAGCEGGLA